MFTRALVAFATVVCCCTVTSADDTKQTFSILKARPGQVLLVQTNVRLYEFSVVDPLTGEAEARVSLDQGRSFSHKRRIFVLGATTPQIPGELRFVKSGLLRKGMRMELGLGTRHQSDRAISEIVRRIAVD